MYSSKLLSLVLLGGIFMSADIAGAQDRHGRGGHSSRRVEKRLSSLIERLKLSSEKEAEVRAILTGGRTGGRQSHSKDRQEIRERLERVLTPEQLKEFDQWSQETRGSRGRR